ncbi:lysine histidine transporter-like 8 [Quillaja saponaria]|uniref:Lysine histidine transporter-like 8 n=1 Tax=Quillaja saponaria TaxID=32244 RepID=A0AAD7PT00_QUISA|nr:lysine histidine transporter-like 8 [Quillaja saponaria]
MDEVVENEIISNATTPRAASVAATPPISAPPSQFHSPSLSRSSLLSNTDDQIESAAASTKQTPKTATPRNRTPRFITPIGSPVRRALRLTRLQPQDAWLPITESRNGNAYYAAFHTLCSGLGIQALILPVAFPILGWAWGVICLTVAFIWQLYTLYLLVQLHESTETGLRYSRYLQLFSATVGDKLAKLFGLFPILYLSGGTCVALVIIGGTTLKTFFQIVCGATCSAKPLTGTEWFLVFTCAAVILSQLPNLNSIAGVSLIGAITAIGYCTLIWVVSVAEGKLPGVTYSPVQADTQVSQFFSAMNAVGVVAFTFRGHNLILEIQGTMPSSEKHPSRVPMWRGTKFAYLVIAFCVFPLAIGGYWAYGQMIPKEGGTLTALYAFHGRDSSESILELISLFVIISSLCSFQIYGMPMFDEIESQYVKRRKQACPWWLRLILRALIGFAVFFVAVAIPFLGAVAGLVGGISLPVTSAFPCFMWLKMKKPKMHSPMWCLNWALGVLGMALSGVLIAAGIYVIVDTGIGEARFFKP